MVINKYPTLLESILTHQFLIVETVLPQEESRNVIISAMKTSYKVTEIMVAYQRYNIINNDDSNEMEISLFDSIMSFIK